MHVILPAHYQLHGWLEFHNTQTFEKRWLRWEYGISGLKRTSAGAYIFVPPSLRLLRLDPTTGEPWTERRRILIDSGTPEKVALSTMKGARGVNDMRLALARIVALLAEGTFDMLPGEFKDCCDAVGISDIVHDDTAAAAAAAPPPALPADDGESKATPAANDGTEPAISTSAAGGEVKQRSASASSRPSNSAVAEASLMPPPPPWASDHQVLTLAQQVADELGRLEAELADHGRIPDS